MAFVNENNNGGFFKKHWSILVLVAVFCNFLCLSGVLFNYNLLYIEIMHSFNSTSTQAGIPGALSFTFNSFTSPIVTVLYQILGHRITVVLGVSLCCAGLLSSSFVQHIAVLYITYGFMFGVGFNACNLTCTDMILRVFDKRNATRATCTALCAISVGFLMSPGIEWLYETYSWRVSFRILSVILACVGYSSALVMMDIKSKKKKSRERKPEQSSKKTVSIAKYGFLLRRRGYSFGLLGCVFTAITTTFTFISMGNFLLENGMDISSISFIIFLMGVGDIVGRIVAAIFSDRLPISRICQHALSSLLTALPTICLPFIGSHTGQTVAFIVMSLPRSLLIVLMPSIAMELATDKTTSESMAVTYLAFGIGAFTTPYLTDLIYEITGSYDIPWFICTGLYVLAAGFMLLADRARKQNLMTDARQYNLVHKDTIEYKDTQIKSNQIENRTHTAI